MKLYDSGVYLVNGKEIMTDAAEVQQKTGKAVTKEQAAGNTIAYGIPDCKSIWLRAFSDAICPDKLS